MSDAIAVSLSSCWPLPVRQTLLCCIALLGGSPVAADTAERDWWRFVISRQSAGSQAEPHANTVAISMVTDLDAKAANALLLELHRFDALVDEFVAPFVPLAQRIAPKLARTAASKKFEETLQLVVMGRRKDFNRLFDSGHFAAFTIPRLDETVLVVGPMGGRDSLRENLLHEYVHYRLRRDVPGNLPLWFEEGLASFLSQAAFSAPTGSGLSFRLGRWPSAEIPAGMALSELLELRDLTGLSRNRLIAFYQTAHALVRYLYLEGEIDANALATSLVLNQPPFSASSLVDLPKAARAIKNLSSAPLRSSSLRDTGRLAARKKATLRGEIRSEPWVGPAMPQALLAIEVRETLANAAVLMNPPAADALYARILRAEPEHLFALLGRAQALRLQAKLKAAALVLEKAANVAPDSVHLRFEEAALSTSGCVVRRGPECFSKWQESVFTLRDVLDEQPDHYEAIYRLGLAHLFIGQPGEALGYLDIAWTRAPWSPRVNYFMGEALRLLGDSRASWYLRSAQRWSASDYFLEAAKAALAALGDEDAPEKDHESNGGDG